MTFRPLWWYIQHHNKSLIIRKGYIELGVEGGSILWDIRPGNGPVFASGHKLSFGE